MVSAGAVLASSTARAQLVAPDSGAHVRIVRIEGPTPQEGSFVDASADSVRINPAYGLGVISLPIRSIQSIDASTGTRTDAGRVLKGAAAGMGIALVATAGITALACATEHGGGDGPSCGIVPYALGGPLTLVGVVAGAWIGAERRVDDWHRIYDRGLATGLYVGPAPRGRLAIGMTIALDVPDPSP
jgi:hypothetical protein